MVKKIHYIKYMEKKLLTYHLDLGLKHLKSVFIIKHKTF